MSPSYAFMRRPRWIVAVLIVVVAAVGFVSLGQWQLRRWEEKRDRIELAEERLAAPVGDLDALLAEAGGDPEAVRFRRATVTGEFDPARELLLRGQVSRSRSGNHVITPLVTDGGSVLLVDRGWVPLDVPLPVADAAPTAGGAIVTGIVFTSETRGPIGAIGEGRIEKLSRVDLGRLGPQFDEPLYPVYLRLESQQPAPAVAIPLPEPPSLSQGPHLGYAIQWFLFTAVVLIGFPILVYQTARSGQRPRGRARESRLNGGA